MDALLLWIIAFAILLAAPVIAVLQIMGGRLRRLRRLAAEQEDQKDLAWRVRDMKAAGRTEQAVFLVRGETGMGEDDARRFVNSL
ncbi:hypothetical protein [Nonomuraea typhae]|uniref:hypothetical protein n=1 Tax=Nonomuraea typhae TaxID=2603600 RepID=UPI0012F89985|nr:hypothetical protein [Nonomuraea typhae]